MITLSREVTVFIYFIPFRKGVYSNGKNLLPWGANSFLLEQTPFQKGLGVLGGKQEVTKVISLLHKSWHMTVLLA